MGDPYSKRMCFGCWGISSPQVAQVTTWEGGLLSRAPSCLWHGLQKSLTVTNLVLLPHDNDSAASHILPLPGAVHHLQTTCFPPVHSMSVPWLLKLQHCRSCFAWTFYTRVSLLLAKCCLVFTCLSLPSYLYCVVILGSSCVVMDLVLFSFCVLWLSSVLWLPDHYLWLLMNASVSISPVHTWYYAVYLDAYFANLHRIFRKVSVNTNVTHLSIISFSHLLHKEEHK